MAPSRSSHRCREFARGREPRRRDGFRDRIVESFDLAEPLHRCRALFGQRAHPHQLSDFRAHGNAGCNAHASTSPPHERVRGPTLQWSRTSGRGGHALQRAQDDRRVVVPAGPHEPRWPYLDEAHSIQWRVGLRALTAKRRQLERTPERDRRPKRRPVSRSYRAASCSSHVVAFDSVLVPGS